MITICKLFRFFILFLAYTILVSCGDEKTQNKLYLVKIKDIDIKVELAINDAQRRKGLQNRESIPEGFGMLFCYGDNSVRSFWMRDTFMPLSIAFIEYDGTISEIEDMKPLSEKRITSRLAVKFVLEVPQGFFKRNAIVEGDKVTIPEEIKKLKIE